MLDDDLLAFMRSNDTVTQQFIQPDLVSATHSQTLEEPLDAASLDFPTFEEFIQNDPDLKEFVEFSGQPECPREAAPPSFTADTFTHDLDFDFDMIWEKEKDELFHAADFMQLPLPVPQTPLIDIVFPQPPPNSEPPVVNMATEVAVVEESSQEVVSLEKMDPLSSEASRQNSIHVISPTPESSVEPIIVTTASASYTYHATRIHKNPPPKRTAVLPPAKQALITNQMSSNSEAVNIVKPTGRRWNPKPKVQIHYPTENMCYTIELAPQLDNCARGPERSETGYKSKCVKLFEGKAYDELSHIVRTRYVWTRESFESLRHDGMVYEYNEYFDVSRPYQQQFTRVEHENGIMKNDTRSALCAYCEQPNFYELKNSCYAQHMSHLHGIFTDDYLTPNPIYPGRYLVAKNSNPNRKTVARVRECDSVVCPACYEVAEVRCWKSTLALKPLSNYLRHFKEKHRVARNRDTYFCEHE